MKVLLFVSSSFDTCKYVNTMKVCSHPILKYH